jgi:hypothetical protein
MFILFLFFYSIIGDPNIYAYTQEPYDLKHRFGQDVKGWYGEIVSWAMANRVGEPAPPKPEEITPSDATF